MKAKSINIKDIGTECWSAIRLATSDCTKCDRHSACNHSVKGKYPQPDEDQLYQAQLALLQLKEKIRQVVGWEEEGE